jgi:hypothetical protein
MFPDPLDPVLFGVLSAAVEEESVAAYEAGFTDGLRSAAYLSSGNEYDLGAPDDGDDLAPPVPPLGAWFPPISMVPAGENAREAARPRPQ